MKRQKNDRADAEGIAKAALVPDHAIREGQGCLDTVVRGRINVWCDKARRLSTRFVDI